MAIQHVNLLHSQRVQAVTQTLLNRIRRQCPISRRRIQNLRVDREAFSELRAADLLLRLAVRVPGGGVDPRDACFLQCSLELTGVQFADVAEDDLGGHCCCGGEGKGNGFDEDGTMGSV